VMLIPMKHSILTSLFRKKFMFFSLFLIFIINGIFALLNHFRLVTIQCLHSYDSQTHEKSAAQMGLRTPESLSYAQNSKCFELY